VSRQSAKDFLKRIETDRVLRDQLEAASEPEARRQIIQKAGFDFTMEEYEQVAEEMAAAAGKPLTPEELQQVAGGAGRRFGCSTGSGAPGFILD